MQKALASNHMLLDALDRELRIHNQYPFLSASPVSIFSCSCYGLGCIEIKCLQMCC